MTSRRLRIRLPGSCVVCGVTMAVGTDAWWDAEAKVLRCLVCASVAGGSAQRMHDGKKARREERVRGAHPKLGSVILALTDDPQATTAWARGADGERRLGARLDRLAQRGAVLLHDRRLPGTRANVDHIAVAPSGVWVIDAKRYQGQVERRDVGGWLRTDVRLFVGRRDCTKLFDGMDRQVAAIRAALGDDGTPVRPVLCFVGADWGWFARPFELGGVTVTWPKALTELVDRPGVPGVPPHRVQPLAELLATRLPPA